MGNGWHRSPQGFKRQVRIAGDWQQRWNSGVGRVILREGIEPSPVIHLVQQIPAGLLSKRSKTNIRLAERSQRQRDTNRRHNGAPRFAPLQRVIVADVLKEPSIGLLRLCEESNAAVNGARQRVSHVGSRGMVVRGAGAEHDDSYANHQETNENRVAPHQAVVLDYQSS